MLLSQQEREYRIALSHSPGLSPVQWGKALKNMDSAQAIWQASPEELERHSGLSKAARQKLIAFRQVTEPLALLETLQRKQIQVCFREDAHYPQLLRHIPDPPVLLYWRGQEQVWQHVGRSIAIIGTRQPSAYGLEMAQRTARWLAQRGVNVVSGMALGIDAVAHRGALEAGGMTLAVLGSGLKRPTPQRHDALFQQILERGLALSEFAPEHPAATWTFPMRNRIVSGLCSAVVVIEAGLKSGTLITVDCANEQGREVFALPGPVSSEKSAGTHRLIQQGAALLQHPSEIFDALGWPLPERSQVETPMPDLTKTEQPVYELLSDQALYFDQMMAKYQGEASELLSILSLLELKGVAEQLPGKLYKRKSP